MLTLSLRLSSFDSTIGLLNVRSSFGELAHGYFMILEVLTLSLSQFWCHCV